MAEESKHTELCGTIISKYTEVVKDHTAFQAWLVDNPVRYMPSRNNCYCPLALWLSNLAKDIDVRLDVEVYPDFVYFRISPEAPFYHTAPTVWMANFIKAYDIIRSSEQDTGVRALEVLSRVMAGSRV